MDVVKNDWAIFIIYASPAQAIIASDNGLSPVRRQATIWTNAAILSIIDHKEHNSVKFYLRIQKFSLKKMHLKMLSGKWRPSRLGLMC